MTKYDTIFNQAAITAGFSWNFVYDNADRSVQLDSTIECYPCILRSFQESVEPLFDEQQRVRRTMSLYIIHVGFTHVTAEEINVNIEDVLQKFIVFREHLRRSGVQVTFNGSPFPNWQRTDMDEYGLVINLTCVYSSCLP